LAGDLAHGGAGSDWGGQGLKLSVKDGQIILVEEGDPSAIETVLRQLEGHVLWVQTRSHVCLVLEDLGPREEACREPINITRSADRRYVAISNLYPTPFTLDGEDYASIEGFWQSLKCDTPERRRRVAALAGSEAKKAAGRGPPPASFDYLGETITTGTYAHWQLMERACTAKFTQNDEAREALLATGDRPLTHVVRRDSRTIPGVIMAQIWMRIRKALQDPCSERSA
jgi:predicted NAD-dependent protein-ADP-ribosyltransferase YbiA (DUF1768 family)